MAVAALNRKPETEPAVLNVAFPVARYATLVTAHEPDPDTIPALNLSGPPRGLGFDEKQKFHSFIEGSVSSFEQVIERAVESGQIDLGTKSVVLDTSKANVPLASAKRSRDLEDFHHLPEFAFRLNGALVLGRASFYWPHVYNHRGDGKKEVTNGKISIRYALIEQPSVTGRPKAAIGLSVESILEFERQSALITDRVFKGLITPYENALRHATGLETLTVETHDRLNVLSVESRDRQFYNFFERIEEGSAFFEGFPNHTIARDLVELSLPKLYPSAGHIAPSKLAAHFRADENAQFLKVGERDRDAMGLFIANISQNEAQFVGFANYLPCVDEEGKTIDIPRPDTQSRAVSAKLMNMYLRHF